MKDRIEVHLGVHFPCNMLIVDSFITTSGSDQRSQKQAHLNELDPPHVYFPPMLGVLVFRRGRCLSSTQLCPDCILWMWGGGGV